VSEPKTTCHTPTPGKQPTRIPTWKYQAVRQAILKIVPSEPPGIAAKDLPARVATELDADLRAKLGSVAWHTTTVKLHMEVEGELARVPDAKPQRLVRP
jgi:hypothetical protein